MVTHQRTMPLLCLLVRLGWQRDPDLWTVHCRDGRGRRARTRIHLTPTGISLEAPSPGPAQLTTWQAGQLRVALRDAMRGFAELAGPHELRTRAKPFRPEPAPPSPTSAPVRGLVRILPSPARASVAQIAERLSLTHKPKNDRDLAKVPRARGWPGLHRHDDDRDIQR